MAGLGRPFWVGEFGENTYEMIGSTVKMYNEHPEINGWCFWTWKKAPNHYPGLVTFTVPKDWTAVMDWLSSILGFQPPAPATVTAGMKEFLEAAKFKNCQYDERMEQALSPRG